jgi:SSS family solute:Na+ symporter
MTGFTWFDYGIVIVYILIVTGIGSLFAREQKSATDFFLAGRSIWWLPMALSIIATDFSAISFLGTPGFVVAHNLILEPHSLVFIWVLPLALFLFVRFFHRLELITAYEYLEKRFNSPLRTICSLLFISIRVCWLATAIYATSVALTQVMNLPFWACAIMIGGFTALYSSMGGMKGVIWTDVTQFFIFVSAILIVLIKTVSSVPGGLGEIFQTAHNAGRTQIFHLSGSFSEFTTPAVLIGGTFLVLISYGVDQVVLQRYLSARSVADIKRGMIFQACFTPPLMFSLALIGLAIFSYYAHFPTRLPAGLAPDKWFPYFIVHELPTGISGIVIAGLLAATMSSVSSGVNSITAACVVDFYRRFFAPHKDIPVPARSLGAAARADQRDRTELILSRLLTLFWGCTATFLAFVVGRIGLIALIAKTLSGFFGGVLLGMFLVGMILPRANGAGTLLGGLVGFVTISIVGLTTSVNIYWYAPIGCSVTFACSAAFSLMFPAIPKEKIAGLTLSTP